MNKDNIVATFTITIVNYVENIQFLNVFDMLPIGCTEDNFPTWLSNRNAAKHRESLADFLYTHNASSVAGFLKLTRGLSINDTYWVKQYFEDVYWSDVSLYSNDFNDVVQQLAFDGFGDYEVCINTTSPEFGTDGFFAKCWIKEDNGIYLYKRGSGKWLHPYNEYLASQVFTAMDAGISYDLVSYRNKVCTKCELFTNENVGFIPYGTLKPNAHTLQEITAYYQKLGAEEKLYRMLVCDAITFNTDRHVGNHGCLYNTDTLELLDIAPAFDYNLSLFPLTRTESFCDINRVTRSALPKIGENFVYVARSCLTDSIRNDLINLRGFEYEFDGDELFTKERVKVLSELSNQQIDLILDTGEVSYVSIDVPGVSNIYKYRLKYKMTEEDFEADKYRILQLLKVDSDEELEKAIVELL